MKYLSTILDHFFKILTIFLGCKIVLGLIYQLCGKYIYYNEFLNPREYMISFNINLIYGNVIYTSNNMSII